MKKVFSFIAVLLAKAYNPLPSRLKIAIMVFISFVAAGFISLIIRDITDLNITNDYLKLLANGLIPLLTVAVNVIQQWGVDVGTKILASEGDPKTMKKLDNKIEAAQELKSLSK